MSSTQSLASASKTSESCWLHTTKLSAVHDFLKDRIEQKQINLILCPNEASRAVISDMFSSLCIVESLSRWSHHLRSVLFPRNPKDAALLFLDEAAHTEHLHHAFGLWFRAISEQPPEGIRRFLLLRSLRFEESSPIEIIRELVVKTSKQADYQLGLASLPPDWSLETQIAQCFEKLQSFSSQLEPHAEQANGFLRESLNTILLAAERCRLCHELDASNNELLCSYLLELAHEKSWDWKGSGQKVGKLSRNTVLSKRLALKNCVQEFAQNYLSYCETKLQIDLKDFHDFFARYKQENFLEDANDSIAALQERTEEDSDFRRKSRECFRTLCLVDIQDFSQQAKVFLRTHYLPLDNDCLWTVVEQTLLACDKQVSDNLKASFTGQTLYIPETLRPKDLAGDKLSSALRLLDKSTLATEHTLPAIVALPVPHPYTDFGKILPFQIEQSYPQSVAAFIDYMIHESGWLIPDPADPKTSIPIQCNHVALAFIRSKDGTRDVMAPYTEALMQRGIAHRCLSSSTFKNEEAVRCLVAALECIDRPHDRYAMLASLRSALFAFRDDLLFALFSKERSRAFDTISVEEETDKDEIGHRKDLNSALDLLRDLHSQRNIRGLAETLRILLRATHFYENVSFWQTATQSLINIRYLEEQAQHIDHSYPASFRNRLDRLLKQLDGFSIPKAECNPGIHFFLCSEPHYASYPIVILCEPTASECFHAFAHLKATPGEQDCYTSALRRAVACAEQSIIAPVVGDAKTAGWIDEMHPALYPHEQQPSSYKHSLLLPAFGKDSVLERPAALRMQAHLTIRPGFHRPEKGEHEVLWWDPSLLKLEKIQRGGIAQAHLLQAKASAPEQGKADYETWRQWHEQALFKGQSQ
ncbi:MAG: hypothetical protein IPJ88_07690 [Myxococcales bacterium]|nr:MAG: hypothetical protein IPJ88_07690 [Myxococcales bacterium]